MDRKLVKVVVNATVRCQKHQKQKKNTFVCEKNMNEVTLQKKKEKQILRLSPSMLLFKW